MVPVLYSMYIHSHLCTVCTFTVMYKMYIVDKSLLGSVHFPCTNPRRDLSIICILATKKCIKNIQVLSKRYINLTCSELVHGKCTLVSSFDVTFNQDTCMYVLVYVHTYIRTHLCAVCTLIFTLSLFLGAACGH